MHCCKRIVLTGATGLIGKEAIKPLEDFGYEVCPLVSGICNLFDFKAVQKYFEKNKPEYLLHFAWYTGESYLVSDLNKQYLDASLNLLKIFKKNGGKRAIFAGTCFEYEFQDQNGLLKENGKLNPTTFYAKAKYELREKAQKYSLENEISFGWGRIFYTYGFGEHKNRLTPYLINNLKNNKIVQIKYGQLIRDYMYSKNMAQAFAKFLHSEVEGDVNICTGSGISLADYGRIIAKKLGKENLLDIRQEKTSLPKIIIGDNTRLVQEVKYCGSSNMEETIGHIIDES